MAALNRVIFLCLFLYKVEAEVDLPFLRPCGLKDLECSKQLWQEAVPYLARGVPELNMPPLDPMRVNNVKISQANLFDVNFKEGVMKGYKSCIVDGFKWGSITKGHASAEIDLHCNITIKGSYNATASSRILPGFGNDNLLKADGDMKLKLQNVKLKFLLDQKITRNEAGKVILLLKTPIKYKYEVPGPVTFRANKIFLANQDISELAVNFLNSSWRPLIDRFGAPFFKRAMEIIGEVEKSFFKGVPLSKYVAEDMEQYVE